MITSTSDLSKYPDVLAIDLGQHFGYAALSSYLIYSNHAKLGRDNRELEFSKRIKLMLSTFQPSVVVYEDVKRHMSTAAAHAYGGYRAIMFAECQRVGIETVGVGVKIIKKHMTGNGNASKNEMIAAVNRRGFTSVTDDNEADALCILITALETGIVEKA